LAKLRDAQTVAAYEKINDGTLTWDELKTTQIEPSVKISLWEKFKEIQEQKSKSEKAELKELYKNELEFVTDNQTRMAYDKLLDPATTRDDFRAWLDTTKLDGEKRNIFLDKFDDLVKAKDTKRVSQIEEGDPIVLAKVTAAIDLNPSSVTPAQLYQLADQGLGTKHITGLVNRLGANKKQIDDNPIASKYKAELSRLHTGNLFGKVDKPKTSDTYLGLSRKLDAFLSTKPTDEQAQKFFATLIREDVSYGNSFGPNELPGFGENPFETTLTTPAGKSSKVQIQFGDIVDIDGASYQAVGKKNGKVEWLLVKPQ
jgi:hypothetical protein